MWWVKLVAVAALFWVVFPFLGHAFVGAVGLWITSIAGGVAVVWWSIASAPERKTSLGKG